MTHLSLPKVLWMAGLVLFLVLCAPKLNYPSEAAYDDAIFTSKLPLAGIDVGNFTFCSKDAILAMSGSTNMALTGLNMAR